MTKQSSLFTKPTAKGHTAKRAAARLTETGTPTEAFKTPEGWMIRTLVTDTFGTTLQFVSPIDPTATSETPAQALAASEAAAAAMAVEAAAQSIAPVALVVDTPTKSPRAKKDPMAWVATEVASIHAQGLTKADLSIEEGKRFKLVTKAGKAVTWFTQKDWAEQVLAAV